MTKRTETRAPCTKLATAGSSLSFIDKFPCRYSALTVLLTPVRCPTRTLAPADFNANRNFCALAGKLYAKMTTMSTTCVIDATITPNSAYAKW